MHCVALFAYNNKKEQTIRVALCKRLRSNGMVIYAIKIQVKIELMEEGDTSQLRQIACPAGSWDLMN